MKDILKTRNDKELDFYMLHDDEDLLFQHELLCLPTSSETQWTPRIDTLSWIIKHYGSVIDILAGVQNQQMTEIPMQLLVIYF